jgi:hypothetical protein
MVNPLCTFAKNTAKIQNILPENGKITVAALLLISVFTA